MSTGISFDNIRFNKKLHGKGHMVAYAKIMEQFDLSDEAIKKFASALKEGDLDSIKKLFSSLLKQQKLGLLRLYIDYNDIENTRGLNQPMGFALDLAKEFQHNHICEYLTARANEIDPNLISRQGFGKGSSSVRFFSPRANASPNTINAEKPKTAGEKTRISFSLAQHPSAKKERAVVDLETSAGLKNR